MSAIILIHGPNGVGKSTVCEALHHRLVHSAWLESEWCRKIEPFVWNEDTRSLITNNLSQLLRNYLSCSWIEYVIFSYGFHGPRQQIWEDVQLNLRDLSYSLIPVTLICDEAEHLQRLIHDGRDPSRIQRALDTRSLYEALPYPIINTTSLTIEQTADRILEIVKEGARSFDEAGIDKK